MKLKISDSSVVFFLSFFCSISIIPGINSEFQPVAAIVSFFFLVYNGALFKNNNRYSLFLYSYLSALVLYTVVGVYTYGISSIVAFISYLVGPILLIYFLCFPDTINTRRVYVICFIYVVFMLLQLMTPQSIANIINPYLDFVIPRLKLGLSDSGIRGISLTYSEPAHAARFIFLLFSCAAFLYLRKELSKQGFVRICILVMALSFATRSATVFGIFALYFIFYAFFVFILNSSLYRVIRFLLLFIALCSLMIMVSIYFEWYKYGRIGQLYISANEVYHNGFSIDDLQLFGSIRFISVIAAYYGGFDSISGLGVGGGALNLLSYISKFGFNVSDIGFIQNQMTSDILKPGSYIAQVVLDLGMVGYFFSLLFAFYSFRFVLKSHSPMMISIGVCSLLQLFFMSTTTIPVPWIALALSIKSTDRKVLVSS